ncbi:MAG TPA: lipocalin-like domain-containing protein [Candidatus Dormibacteraeota bacterium]|nr:lipocalin-like domain-containing protein [Candidatus Dormibacteraeota bacterium]
MAIVSGSAIAQTSDSLAGTWKLVSASTTATGERIDVPFGPSSTGFITYTREGRMAARISHSGRKPLSVADRLAAPAEERAEAFSTFFSCAGRYTLSGDNMLLMRGFLQDKLPAAVFTETVALLLLEKVNCRDLSGRF